MYIDPPSGWQYGFPKQWDGKQDWDTMLREANYPENDIAFAKKHMRIIYPVDKEPND
jgi:hypothetical protein